MNDILDFVAVVILMFGLIAHNIPAIFISIAYIIFYCFIHATVQYGTKEWDEVVKKDKEDGIIT